MKNQKLLLILICFVAFISLGLPDGLFGVAWPFMHQDYRLPLDFLGLVLLSFTIGYLVASSGSGYLISKMQLGTLLTISCVLTGFSLFGYVYGGVWPVLLLMAFFLGAGGGAIDASINTFAASNFSSSVVNWLHAFYGIGATLGPLAMTFYLTHNYSWTQGYITVALVQLSLALIFLFTRRWWRSESTEETEPVVPAKALETLSLRSTWLGISLFFLYTGTEISIGQWVFTIMTKSRLMSEESAGLWTAAYWGSLTAGRIVFGFVMVRYSVEKMLTLCLLALVVGAVLFALNVSQATVLISIMVMGFSLAPVFPSLISATPQRLGASHAANAIGYQISAAMIGGALIPGFAGLMTEYFGLEGISWIHAACASLLLTLYLFISTLYPSADRNLKPAIKESDSQPSA